MPTVTIKTTGGEDSGSVDLAEGVFGIEPNVAVMHQVVTAQLAARRAGTQSTRTRAEVAGGGAKPWKQKGTGRARQGSIRAPHWRGGGVALGPKPRSYAQRTPKKMVSLALRSALSDRAAEGKVFVVDEWGFDAPRTKDAVAVIAALGLEGRTLVVIEPTDRDTWLSFRNLPDVHVVAPGELNAYDVLVADNVVFSQGTLPTGEAVVAPTKKVAPAAKPAAPAAPAKDRDDEVEDEESDEDDEDDRTPVAEATDDQSDEVSDDEVETDDREEADMASDLPNREKPSGDQKPTVIEPTDRVKSVADKEDPRFAAARKKADKEDRRRTARDKKATEDEKATADEEDDADKPKQTFSFNNTTEVDK
jgi:large subunit ribosomal protein L4